MIRQKAPTRLTQRVFRLRPYRTIRRTEKRAQPRPESLRAHPSHLHSIAFEHMIVARATTACGCGTVGIDRRGGARSDGLSLWPAARGFLFLGRSRCRNGGAQNNDSGDSANTVLIDISVSWSVRGSSLLCLPSKHRPPATIPSIMSHQPRINAGKRWPVLAGAAAQPTA